MPDRAIDQEQMSDEPGGGDQAAGEIEREAEDMPVGEELGRRGRKLRGPPAVGEEHGGPSARKQQGDEPCERGGEPPTAARHA